MTVSKLTQLKGIDIASTQEDDLLTGTAGNDIIDACRCLNLTQNAPVWRSVPGHFLHSKTRRSIS
jgi:hypothetical protein